jgi:hypothetical protein
MELCGGHSYHSCLTEIPVCWTVSLSAFSCLCNLRIVTKQAHVPSCWHTCAPSHVGSLTTRQTNRSATYVIFLFCFITYTEVFFLQITDVMTVTGFQGPMMTRCARWWLSRPTAVSSGWDTSSRSQDQTSPWLLAVLMQQCPDMIEDCSAITVSALFVGLEHRINRPIPPPPGFAIITSSVCRLFTAFLISTIMNTSR